MKESLSKIQNNISFVLSVLALLGILGNYIAGQVGEKKDIEYLQKEVIEMQLKVDAMEKTQIDAAKEDVATQTFIEGHLRLHEKL